MDTREKLLLIFIKESAITLKVLQHFLQAEVVSACDPDELEAAFRAAHTLKESARLVQVDSVHQIGRRIETLLERHLSAMTRPTAVECEAMELAVAWLQRLLVDLQEGRTGSTSLVADALTALELALLFPGKTPLVELLDRDVQQRSSQLSDPFASDPELLIDNEEILRAANDPFADDPDFGIGICLLPDAVELLSKAAEKDQAAADKASLEPEVDSASEASTLYQQSEAIPSNLAEIPFDPFAEDYSFLEGDEAFSASGAGMSQESLSAELDLSEPYADQTESVASASELSSESTVLLDDPFADDSTFDERLSIDPYSADTSAEGATSSHTEPVAAASAAVTAEIVTAADRAQEIVDSLLLPNEAGRPQPVYVCCCFDLSGRKYYLPIEYIIEIAEIPQLLPLSLAPALVCGLVNLRGQEMPVVDLSALEQQQQQPADGVRRLVVVEHQREKMAFLADGIPYLSEEFSGDEIDLPKFVQRHKILDL